ncbi:MAG: 23S rRNA (adenine(2503)-C(2))-methyltransferase RlmN [Clostridia bacterium]|nr:23S rRNA (adenine(2503)-C(2))-methyltransferase RlmN [Clostridia bacterium]
MIELCALDSGEMQDLMREMGQSAFRGGQIASWVARSAEIGEMTNLPLELRSALAQRAVANPTAIDSVRVSRLDGTEKYLYRLTDGNLIEGVLMRYHYGNTLCLSTQVGCRMGCAFCASTLEGCVRSLSAGEMLGQILAVNRRLAGNCVTRADKKAGDRVGNVVLMGSGEPFDNYDQVVRFLRLATDEKGLNLSARGISLSTCGLVDRIYRFADEGIPVTLSLSLHAPNDEIRKRLMPIANRYTIDETIEACRAWVRKTGRRVVFEYALVDGVNTDLRCADELAHRLRGMQCHVNLIPLNGVKERNLITPSEQTVTAFMERLRQRHISVTRRRGMGEDIEGACGQLRRRTLNGTADGGRSDLTE